MDKLTYLRPSDQAQSADERWGSIRDAIYSAAVTTYGKKKRKNTDWFEANITKIESVIATKRTALAEYKRDPSQRNLEALRAARGKAQQTARRCANEYWQEICKKIQTVSDTGNIRNMFEGSPR